LTKKKRSALISEHVFRIFDYKDLKNMRFMYLFIFAFLFIAPISHAAANTTIGIVNTAQVLTESKAAKSLFKQRETLQKSFLLEVSDKEQGLRDREKALISERDSISKDAFNKKKESYEKDLLETGKKVREKKQKLEQAYAKAIAKIKAEMTKATAAVADEKALQLVLTNQNVIIGAKELDITDEVMKRLDKNLPDLKIEGVR
tara:strand:+ start:2957 stop:3565 length:609 start_codon:yes stop_codon:yes gene_type:complete